MSLIRIAFTGIFLAGYTASFAQTLEVTLKKIAPNKGGVVLIALFDQADLFLKTPVQSKKVSVDGPEIMVVFNDLAKGDYAISVFQDVNKNNQLDTNFLGIPTEPYGFSNDAMGTFGPPSFDKAKVQVAGNEKTIIHLR